MSQKPNKERTMLTAQKRARLYEALKEYWEQIQDGAPKFDSREHLAARCSQDCAFKITECNIMGLWKDYHDITIMMGLPEESYMIQGARRQTHTPAVIQTIKKNLLRVMDALDIEWED